MENLSKHILTEIFKHLSLRDLLNCLTINKKFYDVISNDYFWRLKLENDFNLMNYKCIYKHIRKQQLIFRGPKGRNCQKDPMGPIGPIGCKGPMGCISGIGLS